jgi:hypothetical protein
MKNQIKLFIPSPQKDITIKPVCAESVGRYSEAGYTLLELLIALQLTMIIIGIVYLHYPFIINFMSRLEEQLTADIEFENFGYTLTRQLDEIKEIIDADAQNLVFIGSDKDTIRIHLSGNNVNFGWQNNFNYSMRAIFSYYIGVPINNQWTSTPSGNEVGNIKAIHLWIEAQHNTQVYRLDITTRLLKRRVKILYKKSNQ